MPELCRYKRTAQIAKFLIPAVARFLSSDRAQTAISLSETGAALLQGKGAGSGWDLKAEVTAAMTFIRAGATVFDVGANKGEWSRAVQEQVGDVRLFLFEPQATCAPYLEIDGAVLTQAAVGEKDGRAVLYSPGDAAPNASLHERKDSYFHGQIFTSSEVVVVSIDSFMGAHAIQSVDFMKMDIEGHELFALRGAARALARGAIRAMSFEFGSGNINSRTFFRDYWDLLTRHGYEIYRVLPRGRTLRIFRYDEDLEYFRGVSNYVAVWRNVTAPARARAPAFPGWSWQSGRRGSPTKVGKARA
jgi:FkbM family methyltransferase